MPSKKYTDYVPLEPKQKKAIKKKKDTTGLVTQSTFELMFGFNYPTINVIPIAKHLKSFKNPYYNVTKWQK
jgi:hypothetical protein